MWSEEVAGRVGISARRSATVSPSQSGTKKFGLRAFDRAKSHSLSGVSSNPLPRRAPDHFQACSSPLHCSASPRYGRVFVYSRSAPLSLRRLRALGSYCTLLSSSASSVYQGKEGCEQSDFSWVWTTSCWTCKWEHRAVRVDWVRSPQPGAPGMGSSQGASVRRPSRVVSSQSVRRHLWDLTHQKLSPSRSPSARRAKRRRRKSLPGRTSGYSVRGVVANSSSGTSRGDASRYDFPVPTAPRNVLIFFSAP